MQAGINDWGGVSPLTPDFVNPEAPWPQLEHLRGQTEAAGKILVRAAARCIQLMRKHREVWLDPGMRRAVLRAQPTAMRSGARMPGARAAAPICRRASAARHRRPEGSRLGALLRDIADFGAEHVRAGDDVAALFGARGSDLREVCEAADGLRARVNGDAVTYVVNRNINYTNICGYHCSFCAFSKGTRKREGAERGYLSGPRRDRATARSRRARAGPPRCACRAAFIPSFTGDTYLEILRAVKTADPAMHVHAFSPLEVWHGAGDARHAAARLSVAAASAKASAAFRARPRKFSSMRCAPYSAPTSCAPRSGSK